MKTKPKEKDKEKRESPQDFMLAFLKFKEKEQEHKNLTPKGFAILRGIREQKKKTKKK